MPAPLPSHDPAALSSSSTLAIADALRANREALVARWLERITARVALVPNRVFPTEELLNHVPLLIDGIADFIASTEQTINAEAPVIAKAMELGELRHAQGFDAHEILKEHELLAGVLFAFLTGVVERAPDAWSALEVARCWHRLALAVDLVRQATVTHFLRLSSQQVREREERLRRFNRMVSHELKNRVGAIRGAAALLAEPWMDENASDRSRFVRMVQDNSDGLQRVLHDLEVLSRVEADARQGRNVLLPQAAAEAVRQLRDAAQARDVHVRIAEDLPAVEIDAAAVELCLVNFVSNAIKYSDPAATSRWVSIEGELQFTASPSRGELHVRVHDNGIGVPEPARARLFEQFFRAHRETITGVEGTGLGLSIVRDTIESLGGRVWAEFPPEGGSIFAFALPSRRAADAAAAGVARDGTAG